MKTILIIIAILLIGWFGYVLLTDEDVTTMDDATIENTDTNTMNENTAGEDADREADSAAVDAELDVSVDAADGEVREFTLDAFNYGYSETELRVNEGDTVVITLTNSEGFHDWVLDEFDAATERIQEGGTATVTFVADETGTFEYYCSVGSHRAQGMVGTIIVE